MKRGSGRICARCDYVPAADSGPLCVVCAAYVKGADAMRAAILAAVEALEVRGTWTPPKVLEAVVQAVLEVPGLDGSAQPGAKVGRKVEGIQRYDDRGYGPCNPDPEGPWVRYADHVAAMQRVIDAARERQIHNGTVANLTGKEPPLDNR